MGTPLRFGSTGLLEAAPDAIVAVQQDGTIALMNAQAERLFGYDRSELLGRPIEVLVPEALRGAHPTHRDAYWSDPQPRPMGAGLQLAASRKDGSQFPAEISLSAIDTTHGRLVAAAVRDVSDRIRAEQRFRKLLEAAPDAIVCVDAEGRIALVNAQTERLFGYRRDELVGELVEILVPEAKRAAHPARRAGYLTHPEPRPMGAGMELSARRKDGSAFPAEISLSVIDTENGELTSAAIRDVSQQRAANAAQHQLAAIVQSSHDAIMGKTLDGKITSWNPGAERLYGYTAEEMIGRRIDVLFMPEWLATEASVMSRIAGGERVEQFQIERRHRNGTAITVSLSLSPIIDDAGGVAGVASVSRDISERLRAEVKFQGLLEAAPDAIIGIYRDGMIALVNAQAERLFGYSRAELLGQPVEILVPQYARGDHPMHRHGYLGDPLPRPMGAGMQLAGLRKDGSQFPADISLSSIQTEDGVLVSAAIRDVTERLEMQAARERLRNQAERERLEAQLHQSQRLESLGQLAGGVAHDFNNLLAVMLNYTTFVTEQITARAEADPHGHWQEVRDDITQIQRAGERATELTHQLLAFGRREVVRPQVLDINAVIGEIGPFLRRTIGEHIELHLQLEAGLWPVLADPGQLEQVLVNLVVNARDAMHRGGTLSIGTANRVLDDDAAHTRTGLCAGRHVELWIADTGTGIPPAVAERVFEPFFTTKPKGEGTGLGLATVYGIIVQAGGHVAITSTPGAGTTFTMLLPATDQTATSAAAPTPKRSGHGGETVLIVEDEEALREVARRILTRNGYRVLTAADGPEALKMVEHTTEDIRLLLTDVIMPRMLGKELAGKAVELSPAIRVLYMSGYAQPVLASQGTLDPGVALVEKPFSESTLLAQIREVLDD